MNKIVQSVKKRALWLVALTLIISLTATTQPLTYRNPVWEYCTGTWCQYCPCGHAVIRDQILGNMPNAIILAYHGQANSSDPFRNFPGNEILTNFGFSGYPTGTADRTSSTLTYPSWFSAMASRSLVSATVRIDIVKTYSPTERKISAVLYVEPLTNLSGTFKVNLVLLEDSLVYPQTGNAGCPASSPYVHDHVVRAMVNGYLGDTLNTNPSWAPGQEISKTYNYTLPAGLVDSHCSIVVFVYKVGSALCLSEIQQGRKWDVIGTVSVDDKQMAMPDRFALMPNYPNPFNPTTSIKYAVSTQSFVSLKVFNLLGGEVRTLVSEMKGAGVHEVAWDGKSDDGREVPSGIYFCQMVAGPFREMRKMTLLK